MNKKKKINVQRALRELTERESANNKRLNEIADTAEREKRKYTESEAEEEENLRRDNQIVRTKIAALGQPNIPEAVDADEVLRESLNKGRKVTVLLMRDMMTTPDLDDTGIIPIQQQEMLKPLRAGLIYDKVGLNIRFGLSGGKLRWFIHGKAQAQWADEGERLEDSKIDFSKLETQPRRLGAAIPVSREELNDSEGIVESVVREEMPAAIIDLVNDALFTTEGTYTDAKDGKKKNKVVVGPFVKAAENPFEFAADVPTRKELLKMKAKVTKSGIKLIGPCWVMTEDMKTELEDQKVDSGSGRFTCENDHILGYPVFCTPSIGEGNVGFGDWAYQPAGFFDSMNLIADPYTLARNNAVDFVLNARFGTATLYEDAFVLGHKKGENKE